MTYTTSKTERAFHLVRVKPLDAAIVRFALTVTIPEYRTRYSDELLSIYSALALTKTRTKNKEAIETYLKRHGIGIKIDARNGKIQYIGNVRKGNVSHCVKLLKEIITSFEVDEGEFNKKKKLFLEDNRESRDDAKRIARIAFTNLLYDRESIMREKTLDEERASIAKLRSTELKTFTEQFHRGEWHVTIVSDEDTLKDFFPLTSLLTKKSTPIERTVSEERVPDAQSAFITVPGKTNVEVRIGNILPITPDHPAYIPLDFGLAVLGKVGGFSGRLMSTVREKEGLTYGIYARTVETHRAHTAHWNVYTFFTARDLQKGIDATVREIRTIVEHGITENELTTFKEIATNQYMLSHESNATRLAYYHALSLMGYTEKDGQASLQRIQRLTVSEVNAALRAYIDPTRLVIVGAGPVREDGTGITT